MTKLLREAWSPEDWKGSEVGNNEKQEVEPRKTGSRELEGLWDRDEMWDFSFQVCFLKT